MKLIRTEKLLVLSWALGASVLLVPCALAGDVVPSNGSDVVISSPSCWGHGGPRATELLANAGSDSVPVIGVVGQRMSLASALDIKHNSLGVVDAVAAEDINRLPDLNVTDVLQRVTGVQVLRDRGEGSGVAIRGLIQMETTLNGREAFVAGQGRTLNFADIPSELVKAIHIHKTASANDIEGGIGGLIDVRTHRPFDYDRAQTVVSVGTLYGDRVQQGKEQYSVLLSDRWDTPGTGEIGVLVSAVRQRRAWREDQKTAGSPISRTDIVSGRKVVTPNSTSETTSIGTRERTGGSAVVQWRPTEALEIYAEINYTKLKTLQDSYQVNVSASPTFDADSVALFPGTDDLAAITWTNAPVSVLSFARDTVDESKQYSIGGGWEVDDVALNADISYTESYNDLFFSGFVLGGSAARFTHSLRSAVPSTEVSGTDLLAPTNYNYASLLYRSRPFNGDLGAARIDGEYRLSYGFVDSLQAGLRLARRRADNARGLIFGDADIGDIPLTAKPEFFSANPYSDFFPGVSSINRYLVGDISGARNAQSLRKAFGVGPVPSSNPLNIWSVEEETRAVYLMATIAADVIPVDGAVGVRVVQTIDSVDGYQSLPEEVSVVSISDQRSYTDYLPSMNLRYALDQESYLRLSVSKTLTRPDFHQLSPSLTLIRNSVAPELNQGFSGNPALKPIRSKNLDLALERYFNATASAHITGFLKQVDGFVGVVSGPEVHDGEVYQVSRPQNSSRADIRGVEVGYQQFYDSLPGWLSGFGLQANYTYVDSETPNAAVGSDLPLQDLSKHSFNLIAMYERGHLSMRLAYNWRDKFLSNIDSIVGIGAVPVYTKAYGWLDASLRYKVSEHISLAFDAMNLLDTRRQSYYGVETRPQNSWLNERLYNAAVTVRF